MSSMLDRLKAFNNVKPETPQLSVPTKEERLAKIKNVEAQKKELEAQNALAMQKERDSKIQARRAQQKEEARLKAEQDALAKEQARREEERAGMPTVTFVMTACGRPDLMEKTLDSFFKFNTYPIERYIITEDSMDKESFAECERLNREKYGNKLEFIFNERKLGQARSIDLAYSKVETEYVFHCEEDWEFYDDEFIEQSLAILEEDEKVLQAWIRPKTDKILNEIKPEVYEIANIGVRDVLPKSFIVKGALAGGKDLVVRDYMGFSWNPGLKRMSDYRLLPKGYSGFEAEHMIDAFYRAHQRGFKVVSISEADGEGFVKHIGWGRRADNPIHEDDMQPQDFEKAMEAAKKKREEDRLRMESIEAAEKAAEQAKENKVRTPKVSVIMQVYLGDYPGARKDSVLKFHRAVKSFLTQRYNKAELIIVSDGCKIVEEIYYQYYAKLENIKYAYVDKTGLPNMYEAVIGGNKYYRGVPRQVGNAMADGELITYMDSDDMLHPEFLYKIIIAHNQQPNAKWLLNDTWLDHENITKLPKVDAIEDYANKPIIDIPALNAKFTQTKVKEGLIVNTPWLLTHVADTNTKWRDTYNGISEDVDFGRRLREEFKGLGYRFSEITYIRCHYTNLWDV